MKVNRLFIVAGMASCVMLAGCDSSVFTDEKLGNFVGEFYANDQIMTVTKDGASIVSSSGEKVSLTNKKIKGEGFLTEATYVDESKNEYTLSWKKAAFDKHNFGYMLPTLKTGEKEVQYQPSVTSIQGWYDGWYGPLCDEDGFFETGLMVYVVSNSFDSAVNMFRMGGVNVGEDYIGESYYLASSFVDVKGEVKLGISMFDQEDLERKYNEQSWNYYVKKDATAGKITLVSFDGEEWWWTRPSMFMGNYFRDEDLEGGLLALYNSGLFFSSLNEEAKTVVVEYDDAPKSYVEGVDEFGHFVTVGDMKIRGTNYGISVETAEGVKELPIFFSSPLYEIQYVQFSYGESTIEYNTDWDTWDDVILIDGEVADSYGLAIYQNKVVYTATKGTDVYYMEPFDGRTAVLVTKNSEANVWLNADDLMWLYVEDYYTHDGKSFIVNYDLSITLEGENIGQGSFIYYEPFGGVLSFGNKIMLSLNGDSNVYVIADLTTGLVEDTLISQFSIDYLYGGEWFDGKTSLSFTKNGVTYDGREGTNFYFTYILDSMGYANPAFHFTDSGHECYGTFDVSGLRLYYADSQGYLTLVSGFVRPDDFARIYGEYWSETELGIEKVVVTKDGKLFVDTLNSTGDGIVTVEYEYYAFVDTYANVVLSFVYKGVNVNVTFDKEGHCSIFVQNFLEKGYFTHQGLYGVSADSMLSVVDNKVTYNGSRVDVSSISEDGTVLEGTVNGEDVTLTFAESSVTVAVSGSEPVVLTLNETQISAFETEVHENVSDLSRDIKVENGVIYIRNTGDAEFSVVTNFTYVIDEEGNVSITFENSLVYTFTISLVDGEVVISGESSLPPLPPPPPPFF